MAGKGDKNRTSDYNAYCENYDKIFKKVVEDEKPKDEKKCSSSETTK